ncbi:exopolysaccharide biosynthesis polyprenyl glycosylphosphotransferase [Sphingomonas sp. LB-2]|uniref:exopolysaccharide biosynthesis polyprenyl glycosylphosphotransferase n=1 Tax=Sphingomonas caeni TaxID=2984949 RepID=UPI0022317551|nr:exopolysaccharide biosynthesis polyprenyl glycosylphosphotransferase [Sphingomonas caeni]MCW3848508.1 exopolysaccharide biosynthesis polyprenyl glycosylphosphotransferase [Sphingomonas caeni]
MTIEIGRPRASATLSDEGPVRNRSQPSRRTLRFRLHLSLILLDMVCIVASYFVAGIVYPAEPRTQWFTMVSTLVPLYLVTAFGARAYTVEVIQNVWRGIARIIRSLAIAAGAVLFIAFYLKSSAEMSRVIFALGFAGSIVTLMVGRGIFSSAAQSILGGNPYTVVLIADDGATFEPSAFSEIIPGSSFDPESQDPAMYDRLASAVEHADRVVVSCSAARRLAWVHALQGANVVAEIFVPELVAMRPLGIARVADTPTMVIARGPLSFPDRILKRAFDLAVGSVLLLICLPLLLVVALLIRLESRGPIFFVQTRIGRANQQFRMYKFRSMRADRTDHDASTLTARDDDRVTRMGKFIRATSIDELPQLINVLKGEMSIVGPRPHALGARADEKLYWEVDERYWHRHAAKPGLTGLAQVRGFRGATDRHIDLVNRLHADLEYLDGWTIWRDVKIILMTFRVLMHPNAF